MNTNRGRQRATVVRWSRRITPALLCSLVVWSTVAVGHETGANTSTPESAVPFVAVVGISVVVSLLIGAIAVGRWQQCGDRHHSGSQWELPVVLLAVGVVALLAAVTESWPLGVGGALVGGLVAWLGRGHTVSPQGGCADTALGAIVAHRAVEGAVIASIYAASAALGVAGLAVLTLHAGAETAAVGGLYAPLGRWWAVVTVAAVQLAFLGGALVGGFLAGLLATLTVPLLAAVGGVVFVAGAAELQALRAVG